MHKLLLVSLFFVSALNNAVAEAKQKNQFSNALLKISLSPKSPQQIAAFYEGRGFSKPMISMLKQACFITVGIHNKSNSILWHDLKSWSFTSNGAKIEPLNRAYWKSTWKKMGISQAHQSTFRWTLLPEQLDFRSNEHEGGNIIIPYRSQAFSLTIDFKTSKNKYGQPIHVKIEDIKCIR